MLKIYNSQPRCHSSGVRASFQKLLFPLIGCLLAGLPAAGQTAGGQAFQQTDATAEQDSDELKLTGRFHLKEGGREGLLIVKAVIPAGSYIYSLDQKGDIPPSRITVQPTAELKLKGPFKADRTAEVIPNDPIFKIRVEKHKKLVQFYAPIELPAGVDPSRLVAELKFDGQVCSDEGFCMPIRAKKIVARFAGYFEKQAENEGATRRR